MATFPVLVLRGMSTSLYALVSGAAVLWLVEPILLTGLGAALLGLVLHWLRPSGCARAARNYWQRCWTAGHSGCPAGPGHRSGSTPPMPLWSACCWPGSAGWRSITGCVCGWLCLPSADGGACCFHRQCLSRDVVRVELVGSRNAPAVVISRNESAVILFRGGDVTRCAVETTLERGISGPWSA